MQQSAADYIRDIIDEICADIARGDEVKWEARNRELRWIWTNTRTQKQWNFGVNLFKRLLNQGHGDPRIPFFCAFVGNRMTVPEVQAEMQRLEKLKAFW